MIYGYIRVSSDKQTSRYAQAMRGCFASALCGYIVCAFCAPIAIAHAGERTREVNGAFASCRGRNLSRYRR